MVLDCLASLEAQKPRCSQILVVDNGSSDGSVATARERFPGVDYLELGRNYGFAGGMNHAIDSSDGEFVALINLDVTLESDYLAACAGTLEADDRLAGVTGKLLRPGTADPPILDTTGHIVYRNRRGIDRGEREPDRGQYDLDTDLFSICGAAPVFRRSALEDVRLDGEYFDEDFFAYFEDFDLAWRCRLRDWRLAYVPGTVGRHHRGGTGAKASTFILACNHRNRLLVMLRNDSLPSFFRHVPGIAYTELRATLHMLGRRPQALVLAWLQFFRLLPRQWGKRRAIQSGRKVGWRQLEPGFAPYDYSFRAMASRARLRAAIR